MSSLGSRWVRRSRGDVDLAAEYRLDAGVLGLGVELMLPYITPWSVIATEGISNSTASLDDILDAAGAVEKAELGMRVKMNETSRQGDLSGGGITGSILRLLGADRQEGMEGI